MQRIIKFLIAGGISTGVNIVALYIFTDLFGIWYLASAAIAFLIGFFVSFTLQKFWTFGDKRKDILVAQGSTYFLIVLINLGLNILGMYILVDIFHIWYLLASVLVLGSIACESFFLYRLVFKEKTPVANDAQG